MHKIIYLLLFCCFTSLQGQDYFLKKYEPFQENIPSPEEFLGYGIGERHTRHDLIVAYFKKLADISDRVSFYEYGKTHEGRILSMLTITSPENLANLETLKAQHLSFTDPNKSSSNYDEVPVFINLAYNVHGNEYLRRRNRSKKK